MSRPAATSSGVRDAAGRSFPVEMDILTSGDRRHDAGRSIARNGHSTSGDRPKVVAEHCGAGRVLVRKMDGARGAAGVKVGR
ncbi:hypothetical protein EBN03_21690 [Nocardia stercoris]|uniref:Uncharacterized protein n=1 Tax=Nocardia stercoris TaxID=2483361 RepID=A0A3M2L139_9NOCA|nr:hypothetical protein EBN03_21690 [Nocardia stercoris]